MNALQTKENIVKCFDSEVDMLTSNISALKRELLRRHSNNTSQGCNRPERTNAMFQDISSLSLELEMAQQENMLLTLFTKDLVEDNEKVVLELSESKEKLTVAAMSSSRQGVGQAPELILERIHTIWKELGISSKERNNCRNQIENCLEGTCQKLLDEAEEMKERTLSEISLFREDICRSCSSLQLKPPEFEASDSLLQQLDFLRMQKSHLSPILQSAVKRRQVVAAKVTALSYELGIPKELLDENLRAVMDDANGGNSLRNVSDSFLSSCEKAVAELQIEKSIILTKNALLQNEALSMVKEMNLSGNDVVSLVCHAVKGKWSSLPNWWENQMMEMVSRSVTAIGGVIRTSRQFSQHLELVHDTLQKIATVRHLLTSKVRSIIERTQQLLLKTVDRDFDADSLTIFQNELYRLPPLSKEFICACFAEVESLCIEVGVMSQSEIEAHTVVCEALNISSTNRGIFWDNIDQSLRCIREQNVGPFDDVVALSAADCEEWLFSEMKNGTKSYVELEARLFKLEKIHAEVEQLRDRQDSKSKIISLDTQVRILSAQLQEFEDKKCDKQRLMTKKTTSSSLLQEERFRKQMQLKFSSKLEQLVLMLKAWQGNERSLFDQDLLSDDVKAILQNSDRNEFMHLRTVEYKSFSKRPADMQNRESETPFPPNKRSKLSNRGTIIHVPSCASKTMKLRSNEQNRKRVLSPKRKINRKDCLKSETNTVKTTNGDLIVPNPTLAFVSGKKRPVLDPFGNVLSQAMSPHPSSNKENS